MASTVLCRFGVMCRHGLFCSFQHSEQEQQYFQKMVWLPFGSAPWECKLGLQCPYGLSCDFEHTAFETKFFIGAKMKDDH